jgi:glycosyltransferase involved in cell wall biosynthesis
VEAWLVTHSRTEEEILDVCKDDLDRIIFVNDTAINRVLWRLENVVPSMASHFSLGFVSRFATQRNARRLARTVVRQHGVTVVHQPIPVSPREPSFIYGMGCPVIIGPMNGNMAYPDAFRPKNMRARAKTGLSLVAKSLSELAHVFVPGKLRSAVLIYANDRTLAALPKLYRGETEHMCENAVDLSIWHDGLEPKQGSGVKFVCMARLVDWKAIDIAISALAKMRGDGQDTLEIIGAGPEETALRELVKTLGLERQVTFSGWLPQPLCADRLRRADVFLLPSLRECGGAVVLEAMACGIPVIATDWGGPSDYIDDTCGILVQPTSRAQMIDDFGRAMSRLSCDADLRHQLARTARQRVVNHFDWERRIETMLSIYERHQSQPVAP